MLLYMSNATTSELYDDLFKSGKVHFAYQMQKFNHNIILGLSEFDEITALSALPYVKNYKAQQKQNKKFWAVFNGFFKRTVFSLFCYYCI